MVILTCGIRILGCTSTVEPFHAEVSNIGLTRVETVVSRSTVNAVSEIRHSWKEAGFAVRSLWTKSKVRISQLSY